MLGLKKLHDRGMRIDWIIVRIQYPVSFKNRPYHVAYVHHQITTSVDFGEKNLAVERTKALKGKRWRLGSSKRLENGLVESLLDKIQRFDGLIIVAKNRNGRSVQVIYRKISLDCLCPTPVKNGNLLYLLNLILIQMHNHECQVRPRNGCKRRFQWGTLTINAFLNAF